jgi:predicted TIM-barrel fold metal-dependent hydrolase
VVRALADESGPMVEWLGDLGVKFWDQIYFSGDEPEARGHVAIGEGQAIVDALYAEVRGRDNIEVALGRRIDRLVVTDGRVSGVAVGSGSDADVLSAGAVVLATGGFGANEKLLDELIPGIRAHAGDFFWYVGADTAQGDVFGLVEPLGGQILGHGRAQLNVRPDFVHVPDAYLPGWLVLVNAEGRRFFNEMSPYSTTQPIMLAQPQPIYAVFDEDAKQAAQPKSSAASKKVNIPGAVWEDWVEPSIDEMHAKGKVLKADTIAELAGTMGVPPADLEGSLARYNRDVAAGADTLYLKDPAVMRPVATGPFYAVEVRLCQTGLTSVGVRIGPDAAVLNTGTDPIPGLYAAGECTGGVLGDIYMGRPHRRTQRRRGGHRHRHRRRGRPHHPRQEGLTMTDSERYIVVSSDCHAGGAIHDYKPYLERRWHDEFEAWAAAFHDGWADRDTGDRDNHLKVGVASLDEEVNWNSALRQQQLEADGIVGEVLFPNTAPPFFPSGAISAPSPETRDEYERRWAGLQAHNRWLVDFCAEVPGRRAGVAQIFLNDVDAAVQEIEWVAGSGLTGGILLPIVDPRSTIEPLHHCKYDPVFAACAEAGIPVNHHANVPGSPDGNDSAGWAVAVSEIPFFAGRGLWHLIFSGVFDRHPELRFILTEQFCGWIPQKLAELDGFVAAGKIPGSVPEKFCSEALNALRLLPSEYFARNCMAGASFMLPYEGQLRHQIGVERIMWGADYPHAEGTYPYSREALRAVFADIPENECRLMLGETAARVYGLDMAALRAAADRVGPTVAEIGRPLADDAPAFPSESACFTFAGAGSW